MNFRIPVAGILIGLLVACSDSKPNATVLSTPVQQQTHKSEPAANHPPETKVTKPKNPFNSISFPEEFCGDQPPNNSKTNTVNFYPVFINYNESNLQIVKANYCQDALKTFRKDKSKKAIQVASFLSKERADQFQEFLENKLGNVSVEVGKPTLRDVKHTSDVKPKDKKANNLTEKPSILANKQPPLQETSKKTTKDTSPIFPKMNSQQLKELKALIGNNNRDKIDFKVVLPTYLPDGYQIHDFMAANHPQNSISYNIIYRNSNKRCFTLGADNGQWGDGPSGLSTVEVSSPALGKITLEHTDFDKLNGSFFSHFRKDILRANSARKMMTYSMGTMASIRENPHVPKFSRCKGELRLNDAIKIVKSLQYLEP